MLTDLLEFLRPVVAEANEALPEWAVEGARVGMWAKFISCADASKYVEYDECVSADLRWCVWVTSTSPVYGPTLAAALTAASAEGWTL